MRKKRRTKLQSVCGCDQFLKQEKEEEEEEEEEELSRIKFCEINDPVSLKRKASLAARFQQMNF